jgi:hypothetical protein
MGGIGRDCRPFLKAASRLATPDTAQSQRAGIKLDAAAAPEAAAPTPEEAAPAPMDLAPAPVASAAEPPRPTTVIVGATLRRGEPLKTARSITHPAP